MVTQVQFLTPWNKSTWIVFHVNKDMSGEYLNGENLIKVWNNRPYGLFGLFLGPVKRELKKILDNHTKNRHRCP